MIYNVKIGTYATLLLICVSLSFVSVWADNATLSVVPDTILYGSDQTLTIIGSDTKFLGFGELLFPVTEIGFIADDGTVTTIPAEVISNYAVHIADLSALMPGVYEIEVRNENQDAYRLTDISLTILSLPAVPELINEESNEEIAQQEAVTEDPLAGTEQPEITETTDPLAGTEQPEVTETTDPLEGIEQPEIVETGQNPEQSTMQLAIMYTIITNARPGGSIQPTLHESAGEILLSIVPDEGYKVADVVVDGTSIGAVEEYTFVSLQENHEITATFELIPVVEYCVRAHAGPNGTITPEGIICVPEGSSLEFVISAHEGNIISDILVDGIFTGASDSVYIESISHNYNIFVFFATAPVIDPIMGPCITALAGNGGQIIPSGEVCSGDATFSIVPDNGYIVADVLVDGVFIGPVLEHKIADRTIEHTIFVSFIPQ